MSTHTSDEVRKKRLARLGVDTEAGQSESRIAPAEVCADQQNRVPLTDSLMEVDGGTELAAYGSSISISAEEDASKKKFCDAFSRETQLSQAVSVLPTSQKNVSTNPELDHLSFILRVLSAHLEQRDSTNIFSLSDEKIVVLLPPSMKPVPPRDPTDIRYYKSICFDLLSSVLYRLRSGYSQALARCDFKACAPLECFLLEYLCSCVHNLRIEKDRLLTKSLDLTSTLPLELLSELGCQLHHHIRLTLSGIFSVTSSQLPGDLRFAAELVESPLLRLTAPHVLPPHTSLWALANASVRGLSLDAVIAGDQLEVPPGASEVLFNLLGELQLEFATGSAASKLPQAATVYSFQTIFRQLLMSLHFRIRQLSIDRQEYAHLLSALVNLCNTTLVDGARPINELIVSLPCWNAPSVGGSAIEGRCIERLSFLGPFFAASVFADDDPSVVETAFPRSHMADTEVQRTTQALQLSYDLIWSQHITLVKSLLSKATRPKMLDYLTNALQQNSNHGKIQCDQRPLSGEGFMLNIAVLFQRLSVPINVDSVDPRYLFHPKGRIDLKDVTRISGNQDDLAAFQNRLITEMDGRESAPAFNFSTECFFLTAWAMQLGFQASVRKYHRRIQVISDLTRNIKLLSANRSQWAAPSSPVAQVLMNETILARWKNELERQERSKLCCDVALLHRGLLQSISVYYASLCQLLLKVADVRLTTGLSVHATPPDLFAFMPEAFLEDIANFLIFVLRHFPSNAIPIDLTAQQTLVTFVLFIICHAHFVRNPYLVAKFVEVLFFCDPAVGGRANDFHTATKLHPLATSHLISALIQFYIAVESTGATNEFYDKFSIRYNISTIFITWWREGFLKNLFIREAETNEQNFIKFTNRVINDMSFLLEEALDGLKKVRELQDLRDDSVRWSELPRQQQISRMGELAQHERQVRSYLTLANQTVSMLFYLTSEIQGPFLRPEIVDKLAAMLNFNLVQLCGPRCSSLKVRNPESYGWAPKTLLAQLVAIYRHLDTEDGRFALALSKDERCFSKELFEQACTLMSRHGIQTPDELERFARLGAEADELRQNQAEMDYGEIPAEFCDTLISTLMDDPVMLPQSQAIVDRSTIMQHLLNQETDPFNRMPLHEDELIPLPDLKKRIAEWKAEREAKWRSSKQQGNDTQQDSP